MLWPFRETSSVKAKVRHKNAVLQHGGLFRRESQSMSRTTLPGILSFIINKPKRHVFIIIVLYFYFIVYKQTKKHPPPPPPPKKIIWLPPSQ